MFQWVKYRSVVFVISTIFIALVPAAMGYMAAWMNDYRSTKIKNISDKLSLLYAPLYAESQSNDTLWEKFIKTYWRSYLETHNNIFFDDNSPPSVEQIKTWRLWMRIAFQPSNERMTRLLLQHGDQVESEMPSAFTTLISHVDSYKVLLEKWKDASAGEISQLAKDNTSLIGYPGTFSKCVRQRYELLLAERERLVRSVFPFGDLKLKNEGDCLASVAVVTEPHPPSK